MPSTNPNSFHEELFDIEQIEVLKVPQDVLYGPINPAYNANLDTTPDRSRTFDQLQPKLTWRWIATDNVNVFASFGVGFRSGDFNSIGSEALLSFWFNETGTGNPGDAVGADLLISDEYEKEVSQAVEVGVKRSWLDERLRFNASLFNTDVDDNQFFEFFAGPFGLLRVVTTIDELNIRDLERDFTFQATDQFTLYGGFGFLDSEIEKNLNRPLSVGNEVPRAPDRTYKLGMQIDVPVTVRTGMFIRLDWSYIGETWFHTLQGEETPTIWQAFFGPASTRTSRKRVATCTIRSTCASVSRATPGR